METPDPFEPAKPDSVARRVAGSFITGLRFVRHQLAKSDPNLHEGRLRESVMPDKYFRVPDYPPVHDDTV